MLRLADHRGDADLCLDRHRRAGHPGAGARHRGPEPRRRIRRQRHLSQRGRRRQASRLLFELPVRHPDRRPAHRDHRAVAAAEGVSDAGGIEGLGLADSVRDRRAARDLRRGDAAQPAGDRSLRGSQEGRQADRLDPRPAEISARAAAGGRPHRRRHRGVLHLHDLYADLRQIVGRSHRRPDHLRHLRLADLRDAAAADLRRDCPTASAASRC